MGRLIPAVISSHLIFAPPAEAASKVHPLQPCVIIIVLGQKKSHLAERR